MATNRQTLKKVAWNEAYSVGDRTLDAQHKKLIDMINALADGHRTLWSISSAEKLAEILSDMFDYTVIHLKDEEDYMQGIGYPKLLAHRAAHDEFIETMAMFNMKSISGFLSFPEVHRFLIDWLFNHTLTLDMEYRSYAEVRANFNSIHITPPPTMLLKLPRIGFLMPTRLQDLAESATLTGPLNPELRTNE